MITLWKSLIAPIFDYCSQLWFPRTQGSIQKLEIIQKNFLSKVDGLSGMDYWEQLSELKMSSLERRRERYICIYVWKILESQVPNFGLSFRLNKRRGRLCIIPPAKKKASHKLQTLRFNSMATFGPRLFNHLPATVRNISGCSLRVFKSALDCHLTAIPDEPRVPKLVRYCQKSSNSIIDY